MKPRKMTHAIVRADMPPTWWWDGYYEEFMVEEMIKIWSERLNVPCYAIKAKYPDLPEFSYHTYHTEGIKKVIQMHEEVTDMKSWTHDFNIAEWNKWQLNVNAPELYYTLPGGVYPIDLEQFTHSAEVLDTIMQVAGKTWATDACIAGLVHALNDILRPQANLCSFGKDKRVSPPVLQQHLQSIIAQKYKP